MKTWIETFRYGYFDDVEEKLNDYFHTYHLMPLSVSMTMNCGNTFVAVIVTNSEDKERSENANNL